MSTSLQSRFWHMVLRIAFKNQKLSFAEHRANGVNNSRMLGGVSKTTKVEKINIDGIHAEWLDPLGAILGKVILYLHGGGYVTGSIESHRMICGLLATAAGAKVLISENRLTPENPFPAAVDDYLKVYLWLLDLGFSSANIIIAGDSAGGGLSVASVLALKDKSGAFPAGVVCLSPWVDLTLKGQSLLIQVGSEEILQDDSILLAEKAKADDVKVTFKIWDSMWHVWQALGDLIPENKRAFEEIGQFVQSRYGRNTRA